MTVTSLRMTWAIATSMPVVAGLCAVGYAWVSRALAHPPVLAFLKWNSRVQKCASLQQARASCLVCAPLTFGLSVPPHTWQNALQSVLTGGACTHCAEPGFGPLLLVDPLEQHLGGHALKGLDDDAICCSDRDGAEGHGNRVQYADWHILSRTTSLVMQPDTAAANPIV